MAKKCAVCEDNAFGYYPLCKTHLAMNKTGEVFKNDNGEWTLKNKKIDVINKFKKIDELYNKQEDSDLNCIICGKSSNGKHFCIDCWNEYKDKSIDIRITNCKEVQILDQYGNLTIECDDGRKVRSRAEALISNFFYNNKIRSVYEKTIYYKENNEDKTLHPDFYLPDYDMYIEYNEIKKKSYLKSKDYTMTIYKKLGYNVIIMDDKDLNSIAGCLKPKLGIN